MRAKANSAGIRRKRDKVIPTLHYQKEIASLQIIVTVGLTPKKEKKKN